MDTSALHIFVGWTAALFGTLAGAFIGLFFHQDSWAGGYASFRRRMLRLGHISFFGIGFLNILLGLTLGATALPAANLEIASVALIVAVIAMPACCFLAAWQAQLRHLFPLPVLAVLAGVTAIITGLLSS